MLDQSAWNSLPWLVGIGTAALTILGFFVAVLRWIWVKAMALLRLADRVSDKIQALDTLDAHSDLDEMLTTLRAIHDEFQPNGGTSLHDRLEYIISLNEIGVARQQHLSDAIYCAGLIETDGDGYVTYVNSAFTKIAGISKGEALGQGWSRAVTQGDRQSLLEEWERCVKYQRPFDRRYSYETGIHVHGRADPFISEDGTTLRWFAKITPIENTVVSPCPDGDPVGGGG